MKNIFTTVQKFSVITFLFFIAENLLAQPDPGPGAPCWPPGFCIPIDGGISFLVAAGIAFGVKKTWDMKKQKDK